MRHSRSSQARLRDRLRFAATAATLVALVCAFALWSARDGFSADRPRLLSGAAWLPSTAVGQLSLLDGSSGEVAAQVPVANRGDRLDAVQQDSTAYAVNSTTGTIRRVDGATFTVGAPVSPIPGAKGELIAITGSDALYVLDARRGVLTAADPRTLAARGNTVPLTAGITSETAVLDDHRRLWVLDRPSGDLTWLDGDGQHTREGAARPGSGSLTIANGVPVVVDPARGTATALDPASGSPRQQVRLGLRADETVQTSGSPHAERLYVVASRGALAICDLTAASCGNAVPLAADGDPGVPVESGGHLFVPDYATGKVWIIDLKRSRVTAQAEVLAPKTRFQLLARDGVVFFNDPDSEHAGVIDLNGTVRHCRKYDPKDPSKGLRAEGTASSSPSPTARPSASSRPSPGPTRTSSSSSSSSSRSVPPSPTQSSEEQVGVQLSASKTSALVGEAITLRATLTTGDTPRSVQWTFGDGQTASGTTVTHQWASAQTYQVSAQATLPDGRARSASISIQVSERPTLVVQTTGSGTVTGGGINCPGTCQLTADNSSQQVTLTAAPATNFTFAGWGGACSGTATTCTVTMSTSRTVTASFRLPAPQQQTPANGVTMHYTEHEGRPVFFVWGTVAGAASYRLEIQSNGCGSSGWTAWRSDNVPDEPENTAIMRAYGWPGVCQGRWRMTTIAPDGSQSVPTGWWTFQYAD